MAENDFVTKKEFREGVDELAQATAKGFLDVDKRFNKFDERLSSVESDISVMKKDINSLKSGQAAILNVVQSIEGRLKEWENIPAKVERVHRRMFG